MKIGARRVYSLSLFILFLVLFGASDLKAQKDGNIIRRYLTYIAGDTVNDGKPKILVYPTLGFAPETSWEFGFTALYLYYANRDTTNRLSELNAWTFFTLEKQYGIWLDHALYTDKNRYFLLGQARFQRFPLLYYGIGPETPEDPQAIVDGTYFLLRERALRRIKGEFFAGVQIDYQGLFQSEFRFEEDYTGSNLPRGGEGSQNLSLGLSLVYDTRHNVLNVRDGYFAEVGLMRSSPTWGSDYSFTTALFDARVFRPVRKTQVFAAQAVGNFTFGDVPFNQLSLLGGENMMRGYYRGRFRDNHHVAAQVEYRFLPVVYKKPWLYRFGAAVFMSTGTVFSEQDPFNLNNFVISGGAGIRFYIFPDKDIFTRLDVAFTKEGPGYYLFVGEAF